MSGSSKRRGVIIVAGGKGFRMGEYVPKQLLPLANHSVLYYSLQAFQRNDAIQSIILVVEKSIEEKAENFGFSPVHFSKIKKVVPGGKTRTESVWCGLQEVSDVETILIHDGVRPLVSARLIMDSIKYAEKYGAAVPLIRSVDTLKRVNSDGEVLDTVSRDEYQQVQTPQAFRFELLKKIYSRCMEEGITASDDASLVEYFGYKIQGFQGDPVNIKITVPVDLKLAEVLLANRDYTG